MSIEPTNRCQLRCPGCPSGLHQLNRTGGVMDLDLFRQVIDESGKNLIWLNLFFQGEPLLNRQLGEMIRYASQRNIFTSVSTNANLLDANWAGILVNSGLDHLIISVDGMDEEVYQRYRVGGTLSKVMHGLDQLMKAREGLRHRLMIELQFVVTRYNEHQVDAFLSWAAASGADLWRLKSAQLENLEGASELVPMNDARSRYRVDGSGRLIIKNKLANHCWRAWSTPVLTWDGFLVPCCFDKQAQHAYGNIVEGSLREVWKNKKAGNFRRQILSNRRGIPMCNNCTEGLRL